MPGEPETSCVPLLSRASSTLRGRWDCRITNSGSRKILPLDTFDIRNPQRPLYTPWPAVSAPSPNATQHRYTPGFPMCLTGGAAPATRRLWRASSLSPLSPYKRIARWQLSIREGELTSGRQPVPNHRPTLLQRAPSGKEYSHIIVDAFLFPSLGAVAASHGCMGRQPSL